MQYLFLILFIGYSQAIFCQSLKKGDTIKLKTWDAFKTPIKGQYEVKSSKNLFHSIDKNNKIIDSLYFIFRCANCQYILIDNDTLNFYDDNGEQQGWFYWGHCFTNRGNRTCSETAKFHCMDCDFIQNFGYYKNDLLKTTLSLGYKNGKYDTIYYKTSIGYAGDTFYQRINTDSIIELGLFKRVKYIPFEIPIGYIYRYRIKDRKLFYKEHYTEGKLDGDSYFYWENGNVRAKSTYSLSDSVRYITTYREDGTKYAEMKFNYQTKISTKCFDTLGLKVIPCDLLKNNYGIPNKPPTRPRLSDSGNEDAIIKDKK